MEVGPGIVDLSSIFKNERNCQVVADELGASLRKIGAAYLVGHGVNAKLTSRLFNIMKTFFDLPNDVKRKYGKENALGDFNGYQDVGEEVLNDDPDSSFEMKETFDIEIPKPAYAQDVPGFETCMEEWTNEMERLKRVVLKLLSLTLNAELQFIYDSCDFSGGKANHTILRLLKYPSVPEGVEIEKGTVRCAEHSDWEIITFLIQDEVGGLDMKTRDGEWIQVAPVPGSIIVIAGESLEVWTSGGIPAVPHRVPLDQTGERRLQDRYSMAYFMPPNDEFLVEPLDKGEAARANYSFTPQTYKQRYDEHIANSRAYV